MKKTIWIGVLSFLISGVTFSGEKLQSTEKNFRDRDSLVARLLRQARGLNRDVSRTYLPYEVKRSAESFKNASSRLYSCEGGYPRDRYGRDRRNGSYCEREFFEARRAFRRINGSLRRGGSGSYEIENRLQTLQNILRRLAIDYDNGNGRDPYPNEQFVCIAEAEEGWNTRPVRGRRAFSIREAKISALRACERAYNYCVVKSCRRI